MLSNEALKRAPEVASDNRCSIVIKLVTVESLFKARTSFLIAPIRSFGSLLVRATRV
jgi:hypothetical protein